MGVDRDTVTLKRIKQVMTEPHNSKRGFILVAVILQGRNSKALLTTDKLFTPLLARILNLILKLILFTRLEKEPLMQLA